MCLSCVQGAWLGSPCECRLGHGARLGASFSLCLLSLRSPCLVMCRDGVYRGDRGGWPQSRLRPGRPEPPAVSGRRREGTSIFMCHTQPQRRNPTTHTHSNTQDTQTVSVMQTGGEPPFCLPVCVHTHTEGVDLFGGVKAVGRVLRQHPPSFY